MGIREELDDRDCRVERQLPRLEGHIAMRRIAAVFLGTAALLGALATPASAAPSGGTVETAAANLVDVARNAITGVEVTLDNVTSGA
ncbi:hypothetical protein [Streptomyces syringium]|uniref:Uncharacterized protein n=1 Tax=Streptomyces syringium TaxID=76729 RepID=A0ABS4Y617_9ACTN|nr:hypothetical protein [Streptomyces syringium]MBP2404100.1 hypothetical protein [Streptomyces syringium]